VHAVAADGLAPPCVRAMPPVLERRDS